MAPGHSCTGPAPVSSLSCGHPGTSTHSGSHSASTKESRRVSLVSGEKATDKRCELYQNCDDTDIFDDNQAWQNMDRPAGAGKS